MNSFIKLKFKETRLKKTTCAWLSAWLIFYVITTPVFAARFVDLDNNWAQKYINYLSDKNIIAAEPDGKFNPDKPITRAILATWLVKELGLEQQPVSPKPCYKDVKPTDWYYKYIEIARQSNLFSGYADGFRPNQFIQKGEVLVILCRCLPNVPPDTKTTDSILDNFTDKAKIPGWAQSAVAQAYQDNILVNYPNSSTVNALEITNKALCAAMLYQLDRFLTKEEINGVIKQKLRKKNPNTSINQPNQESPLNNTPVTMPNSKPLVPKNNFFNPPSYNPQETGNNSSSYPQGYAQPQNNSSQTTSYPQGYAQPQNNGVQTSYPQGYAQPQNNGVQTSYPQGYAQPQNNGVQTSYPQGYAQPQNNSVQTSYPQGYAQPQNNVGQTSFPQSYAQPQNNGGQTTSYSQGYAQPQSNSSQTTSYPQGYAQPQSNGGQTTSYPQGYTQPQNNGGQTTSYPQGYTQPQNNGSQTSYPQGYAQPQNNNSQTSYPQGYAQPQNNGGQTTSYPQGYAQPQNNGSQTTSYPQGYAQPQNNGGQTTSYPQGYAQPQNNGSQTTSYPQGYAQPQNNGSQPNYPSTYQQPVYQAQITHQAMNYGTSQTIPVNVPPYPNNYQIPPYANTQGYYPNSQTPRLMGNLVTIAAGTPMTASLKNSLDSGSTQVGEPVETTLANGLMDNGNQVLPPGSKLIGQVTDVISAKRFHFGANGKLAISFNSVQLPDGRQFPIQASVDTSKLSLTGGSTKGRVGKSALAVGGGALGGAALGTGLGAIVGATGGGMVGRSTGMGAVFGTAIGSGVGLVGAGVRKGSEIKLTAGTELPIELDAPLNLPGN